ncbi:Protein of unknown function, DUF488 [Pontibaca methylaminivorans]|uniref:DUF488 domain-containing protein n=1 Tax=Pontibaca methylaminivorans TaxID=515897 RepID=A0A1R3WLZ1_9RHOB|nr:Protein of unknown function, DUF488 [Pontibaca methylaminivorans]
MTPQVTTQPTPPPFFTIGHSNRPLSEFLSMLTDAGVRNVADVRRFPASRTFPAYNGEALRAALGAAGIGYAHCPELGGRRSKQGAERDPRNGWWENTSFHNYADYALGDGFQRALGQLIKRGQADGPLALMCSEAVWWRCHRRIISDYLLDRGCRVVHLMGVGHQEEAHPTRGALSASDGRLIYPPQT